jgi:hypothetical protein
MYRRLVFRKTGKRDNKICLYDIVLENRSVKLSQTPTNYIILFFSLKSAGGASNANSWLNQADEINT